MTTVFAQIVALGLVGAAQLHMTNGSITVVSAGALCNGTNDDTVAIQAALNFAYQSGGGRVLFPNTQCSVSSPVIIPYKVRAVGVDMGSSGITASASFPANSAVVIIGSPTGVTSLDYSSIEEMWITANGKPGSTCIYSNRMQEGSYIESVGFSNFTEYGINLETYGVMNSYVRNFYGAPATGAAGANAIGIRLSYAISRMVLEKGTLTGNGAAVPAILLENASEAAVRDYHCEGFLNCIKVDSSAWVEAANLWGNITVPMMVHLTSASTGGTLTNLYSGGSHGILQDDLRNIRIDSSNTYNLTYYESEEIYPGIMGNLLTSNPGVPVILGKLQISPATVDPGCTTAADLGKLWENTGLNPTKLQSCQSSSGTFAWQ